ncbi:hypothetical protein [Pseudoteredinibacter isoporae]|uniref:hypothetical protein n=1 Tax=Pseudoteredinibacter isoporae TaxID=570281 RepID=UPI003105F160
MMYQHKTTDLYQSFTLDELKAILGISSRTASRYRSGKSKPPIGFTRLLAAIRSGRIMPEQWPTNIHFRDKHLITGTHRGQLNWAQLQHYEWALAQWKNALRLLDRQREELDRIKPALSPAQQLSIAMISRPVTALAANDRPESHQLREKLTSRQHGC